jgi:adenine-specific DNA-methyltransferase
MEKLKMKSQDLSQEHIAEIKELFPDAVTEVKENGIIKLKVDFDVLRQELSDSLIDDKQERYQMTWPGKREAVLETNTSTTKTLRPLLDKSKDFYSTKNIYVEGNNLDVLKVIRETYLGKVKMIYIDPPYNTGSDFLYSDSFDEDKNEFLEKTNQVDEEGKRLVQNTESTGRFHSKWINKIYPQIRLGRDLLSDDGVMFISIDDHEIANMLKICSEIFSDNQVDVMVWRKSGVGRDGKMKNTSTFRKDHEYIVVCFKRDQFLDKTFEKPNFVNVYPNPDNDPRGPYKAGSISRTEEASNPNSGNYYTVYTPKGTAITRQFDISKEEFDRLNNDKVRNDDGKMVGRVYWGKNDDSCPSSKIFVNEKRSVTTSSFIVAPNDKIDSNTIDDNDSTTTKGSKELDTILGIEGIGNEMRPKPSSLIKNLVQIATKKDSLVMDFFSGSGTTAQAVMEQNSEDGGNRKFIMVQLEELCGSDTIAYKSGYKSICDLALDRIEKSGKELSQDVSLVKAVPDIGIRVFKLDSSNMKDVYYSPADIRTNLLDNLESNIKDDRSSLDILIQCMLSLGIPLDSVIKMKVIMGKTCYVINDNDMVCCFDEKISETIIKQLADIHPLYACFKDSSFENDSTSVNCEQIFKTISPTTKIRVI